VNAPEPDLALFLEEHGLAKAGEPATWDALDGGVSSDIWHVETSVGAFCVKRARAQLKVAAEWKAPIGRNAHEWAYLQVAAAIAPGAVPQPIAHDPRRGLFAMSWLPSEQYELWKRQLLEGRVDGAFAASVGDLLGRIHLATAHDPSIPGRFATDSNFHALRIDPYLLATARVHPDLASRLERIARTTCESKGVLVHGDVSPKNILKGELGPVLLDAEVAWFGDPAFDLAFCLTHLVIKVRVVAEARAALLDCIGRLTSAYFEHVDWEPRNELENRAAALLPALALARVDGKSPLEYLDEDARDRLRFAARHALAAAPRTLVEAQQLLT
jgi:aminoglycoside phosphotransferase (APT) family kinase protein